MPCIFCDMGICVITSHGVVRTFELQDLKFHGSLSQPSEQIVKIFDVRGLSYRPIIKTSTFTSTLSVTPKVQTAPSIIVHGMPFRDYLRLMVAERSSQVRVEAYSGGWEKRSPIVKDAGILRLAWEKKAWDERGTLDRTEPDENMCSAGDWTSTDEGIDVAREIEDVDSQFGRSDKEVTLWKAYRFGSEVVGILITWDAESDGEHSELGIRWLVGHPTVKGPGTVLMAKADELHRSVKYNQYPMHVTAAASSVTWYESKGFVKKTAATCNDNETPCGCVIMQKPRPKL